MLIEDDFFGQEASGLAYHPQLERQGFQLRLRLCQQIVAARDFHRAPRLPLSLIESQIQRLLPDMRMERHFNALGYRVSADSYSRVYPKNLISF